MTDKASQDEEKALAHTLAPDLPPSPPERPRIGGGARAFGLTVLLALASGLAYGGWQYVSQQKAALADVEARESFVPTLNVVTLKPNDNAVSVTLPATTSAFAEAKLYARASGYIAKRLVDIGDHVKKGQLLALISAPELEQQIAQAEATLAQTRASLKQSEADRDLAASNWQRDKPLLQKGWVSKQKGDEDKQTLDAKEAAVNVAQANISAQQAQLKVLHQQRDYLSVVAPFDGVITKRNIDVGSLVQADDTTSSYLFTIMQSDVIRVQVHVPQDQAFGVAPGVPAIVRVPEMPDRSFRGKVTRIADAVDPATRTLLTEIDVPNPDGTLLPGIYCEAELHIPRKVPSLVIPSGAIVFNAQGLHVAVAKDGEAHFHSVKVMRDFGTTVEVSGSIKAGDKVILDPPVNLANGAKVNARPVTQNGAAAPAT